MLRQSLVALLVSTGASAGAVEPVKAVKPAAPAATPATAPTAQPVATPSTAADDTPIVVPDAITAPQRALIRLQILLDRAHFSPGVIDGKDGGNLRLAAKAYAAANGTADADDAALTDKLAAADDANTVERYKITAEDVAGPFTPDLPTDYAELAKLASPAYGTPAEALAERFHMDEALLKALNPKADFATAGTIIVVAAVKRDKLAAAVTRIEVDKSANAVRAFAADKLVAVYPATVGSTERPAPSGTWKVRTVATKATYTFDPKRLTFGDAGKGKLTIKAGPNNPVGTTWIDLTKDTYGIHGSPDPRLIGKRASHGCVRLTNWDAEQLAKSVKAGATVVFTGAETRAKT